MSYEPPREAKRQADGSYLFQCEDGSTMRYTRRPDGTWRKPEHKRAGWVGELEQTKYVSKGAEIEQKRQEQMQANLGYIPGAPPGAPAAEASSNQTQASKRNERKKEKRREKAEEKEAARVGDYDKEDHVQQQRIHAGSQDAEAPGGKNEKALRKKLKQIEELEQKRAEGKELNEDQLQKVAAKSTIEAELRDVLAGESLAENEPSKVSTKSSEASTPAGEVPAAEPSQPAAPEAPKSKKALEKRLRQITELEVKEKQGKVLNEDERAKVASKKQVEADLKTCC